jgi:Flp pilus assembly protein TadG
VRRIDVRRDDGVAMAEFALVLPVFLVIIGGLLAFGRVFFYWIEANHLASETARWAVVDRNPWDPISLQQHAAQSATQEFATSSRVCISFPDAAGAEIGNRVLVKVEKPFSLVPILNAGTITVRGSSTMRIERFEVGDAPTNYAAGSYPGGTCS